MNDRSAITDLPHDGLGGGVSHPPVSHAASLAEASARLQVDHEEFVASLGRLRDFVVADDVELAEGEWNEFEEAILGHMDSEEMFLIPRYARDEPAEAAALRTEHAEIRKQLGDVGLAVDLHTLRLEPIDAFCVFVTAHFAHEARSLYTWTDREHNRPLLDAVVRRLPHAGSEGTRDARTAATLLGLVKTCRDGEQGYRRAVLDTVEMEHRELFARLAEERARFARELRDDLRALGVTAQLKGTVLGTLHRGWIDTSARVARGSPRAILRECERGDEVALRAYRAALRTDLAPPLRAHVSTQFEAIRAAIREIRALSATAA